MKIKEFTEEEMAQIRENEYILDVTPEFVYYSAEFKERFYREYQQGKKPRKIIEGMGIDTNILGQTRVNGIKRRVLRDVQLGKGFTEITSESCVTQTGRTLTPETKIRRLEHELAYTRQELEFVKKIIAAGREERK